MRRGTTPQLAISVNADLRQASEVWLTINDMCGNAIDLKKTELEITETSINASLTQAQTLMLSGTQISIQLRALYDNGVAVASNIEHTGLDGLLKDGEISAADNT